MRYLSTISPGFKNTCKGITPGAISIYIITQPSYQF